MAHVVIQAGADTVFHGLFPATPDGKGPVKQAPGFAGRHGGCERAEIAGSITSVIAHYLQAREFVFRIDAEKKVIFVIS